MQRIAMFGAGSMMLAAALAGLPTTARSQPVEAQTMLVGEGFAGETVDDPDVVSLDRCLTSATGLGGEDEFDPWAEHGTGLVPPWGERPGCLRFTGNDR